MKMADKEKKLAEFRAKTATPAQKRLKQQQTDAKKAAELKKAQELERRNKTKSYAAE